MCVEEHETGSAFQWATRHMRTAWACNQCILKPSLFFPHMQPWPPTTVPGTRVVSKCAKLFILVILPARGPTGKQMNLQI